MATMKGRIALTLVAAALVAAPAMASRPVDVDAEGLRSKVLGMRSQLGLTQDHDFKIAHSHGDELGQTHAHLQQTYKGITVFGGDVVAHADKTGRFLAPTLAHKAGINLNVNPVLSAKEALAVAHGDLAPRGGYAYAPTAELIVYPETAIVAKAGLSRAHNAEDFEHQVVRHTLAYLVHAQLENGSDETVHRSYVINANTGAMITFWDDLHSGAVKGTGNSQYSGVVQIDTNQTSTGYELRDMTRGTGGTFGNNVVTNLNHGTSGNGTVYTNPSNTWGDGNNYTGSTTSTTGATGQTAAVDAHYGIMSTWDMYKNVLGRNGIDGTGKASYLRVHYSTSYDNAFWSDSCFCMTFGDGSSFKSLESVDVAGHEMSHGVCANNGLGGLTYSGESGGLNESNSDVMGTMVEFYDLGGGVASGATTIPDTGGNWTIGEQLETASFPTPLRYMYKPSKDGSSPDAWYSGVGSLDVHYSSGPGNRQFYFLSQGASSSSTSDYYSSYTPAGFTGVGNDHATRIHYRALTTYYNTSLTYAQCRTAHINAAKDLYGAGSPEEIAVWNSFAAINVGSAWTSTALSASISAPAGNVTTTIGTTVSFAGSASGGTSPYTYSWTFGDGASATTASASHAYTAAGTYTATFKVTDSKGATSSVTRTITVNAANALAASITSPSGNVTIASGTSQSFAGTASGGTSPYSYSWNFGDGATGTGASASHTYTNTGTANVTYTATLTVTDAVGANSSATRTVTVTPAPTGGTELVTNGGFESGATGWSGTTGDINTWSGQPAHGGTKNAWICGNGTTASESLSQSITIPATATGTLTFWMHIDTAETTSSYVYDTLKVQVVNGTSTTTLATYSNLNKNTGYVQKTFDLSAYRGKTVTLKFAGSEDSSLQTSFVIDDVSVK